MNIFPPISFSDLLHHRIWQGTGTCHPPANDRNAVELTMMSDVVIDYEKEHYPIGKPTVAQLIQLSLDEKNMSQKQLATEIGVSPSRISDYVSGRAEPTLKIARLLCATLGITPAAMLGY